MKMSLVFFFIEHSFRRTIDEQISFILSPFSTHVLEPKYQQWKQHANTVAGRNGKGSQLNWLSCPCGICVDHNRNALVAVHYNHRIIRWKCGTNTGTIVAGGNGRGNRIDQLSHPTDVIFDKQNHSIIIADYGNKRVMRWWDQSDTNQQILIDNTNCSRLAMDKEGFLYVSYTYENEVRRWKEGEREDTLVAGGNGERNQLNQLCHCKGVVMDRWGQIYVVDSGNQRVMRWREGESEGKIVVGGNGQTQGSNQLFDPLGLSFDDEGNLFVADRGNHRIQKFDLILS